MSVLHSNFDTTLYGPGPYRPRVYPPVFASIATFVIDEFDTEPVHEPLNQDAEPPLPALPSPKPSPPPDFSLATALPHTSANGAQAKSGSRANARTAQLTFDDVPPPSNPFKALGGSAPYAVVGARIFLPSSQIRTVIDRQPTATLNNIHHEDGHIEDLPDGLERRLNEFGRDMWAWNRYEGARIARARIGYTDGARLFQYLVHPPKRTFEELLLTPVFGAEYLHICAPFSSFDMLDFQEQMHFVNSTPGRTQWHPKIVFEPAPWSCQAEQRGALERAAAGCEVLSPNQDELLCIYSRPPLSVTDPHLTMEIEAIMWHLLLTVGVGKEGMGIVVVRCGRMGCCVGTKSKGLKWFPAFFEGKDQVRVRDVTGAGNAFLGGYVAGLKLTGDPYEAALYGTIASSFMVEQAGLPTISSRPNAESMESTSMQDELWNGDIPTRRVQELRVRL